MSGSAFVHRYEPGGAAARHTVLLLHGTGGDESDLLPMGQIIAPGANLLSPRGPVLEHGMPRFFRRLAEGVFDEPDLHARTSDLAAFVAEAAAQYSFDVTRVHAIGFSNGANIAASLLLSHPGVLASAVLFRAMVPFEPASLPDLRGRPVLLAAGTNDPIVPRENSERLADLLQRAGAAVTRTWSAGGHGLSRADADAAGEWWQKNARLADPEHRSEAGP